jgi:hypothetical protein
MKGLVITLVALACLISVYAFRMYSRQTGAESSIDAVTYLVDDATSLRRISQRRASPEEIRAFLRET